MKHYALKQIERRLIKEAVKVGGLNYEALTICPSCSREYLVHGACYTCGYVEGSDCLITDDELHSALFDDTDLLDIDFFKG